jgi:hypothetical protein
MIHFIIYASIRIILKITLYTQLTILIILLLTTNPQIICKIILKTYMLHQILEYLLEIEIENQH